MGGKRILPKAEKGVAPEDFHISQEIYDAAAAELGMSADDLQAIMWFHEKSHWDANGWTGAEGRKLSDFRPMVDATTRATGGQALDLNVDALPDAYLTKPEKEAREQRLSTL